MTTSRSPRESRRREGRVKGAVSSLFLFGVGFAIFWANLSEGGFGGVALTVFGALLSILAVLMMWNVLTGADGNDHDTEGGPGFRWDWHDEDVDGDADGGEFD